VGQFGATVWAGDGKEYEMRSSWRRVD